MNEIAEAIVAFQAEMTNPPQNSVNPFFKSKYTDLPTLIDHCRPILAKHGLAIVQMGGEGGLRTIILHASGEMIDGTMELSLPTDPQKAGACITYFRRYMYCAAVGCAGDPDDDANSAANTKEPKKTEPKPSGRKKATNAPPPAKLTPNQLKKIQASIGDLAKKNDVKPDTLRAQFKKFLKVVSMNDITSQRASVIIEKWADCEEKFTLWLDSQREGE